MPITLPRIALAIACVLPLAGLAAAFAWGSRTSNVSGTVTYAGKPLASGTVFMIGTDNVVCYGPIDSEGRYSIRGVRAPHVKIGVTSPKPETPGLHRRRRNAERAPRGDEKGPPASVRDPDAKKWFPIPTIYGDAEKSGLEASLSRGRVTQDIDLK